MTFFIGTLIPGDRIVAVQGGLRLAATVLEEFNGGPGQRAALTVGAVEVRSGAFPSHVDQLTLNVNNWKVYREGDSELQERSGQDYASFAEAFTIFDSYPETSWVATGHYEIFAGPSEAVVSKKHRDRLRELGWMPDADRGGFYYFV